MVDDVDAALAALIATYDGDGAKLACSFDAPTLEWSSAVKTPTLNLFLVDIRENLDARPGEWAEVRDENGNLLGRQPPLRRYDLRYLLSAWGGDTRTQHRALAAVLASPPEYDTLPVEFLSGSLAEQELPVRLRYAQDDLGVGLIDVWSALGQPPRASLSLVVTAPLLPKLMTDLAPPASSLDIGLAGSRPRRGHVPVPDLTGVEPVDARVSTPSDEDRDDVEGVTERRWTKYRVREHIED